MVSTLSKQICIQPRNCSLDACLTVHQSDISGCWIDEGEVIRGCSERRTSQAQNPGIKFNSKMVIFDNHLAPIYYMYENMYPNMASTVRVQGVLR